MALWGVSGSDLKTVGLNTAVSFGVTAGCIAVAWAVKRLALMGFAAANKSKLSEDTNKDSYKIASALGAVAAVLTGYAAYKLIPAHFTVITDDSNSKMLKIGIVTTIVGFILDCFIPRGFYTGTVGALGGVGATRFGPIVFPIIGAYSALVGTNYLQRPAIEEK